MRLLWIAALALLAASAPAQEVYRSIDEHGVVIYSDRPQGRDAEPVRLAILRPSSVPRAAAPADPRSAAQAVPQDEELMAEVVREPAATEVAAQRARNCEIARERMQLTLQSRRLYRTLPDGEREYLDDAEIDEARARAMADVETWCS